MPPQTDRERLAHFVELIGAEPHEAVFDEFENLISLSLAGLQLTTLPPTISEFIHLTMLILGDEVEEQTDHAILGEKQIAFRGNRLTLLPPELTNLTSLQVLAVNNNQLTSIPVELAQLVNLQVLDLNNNQLTSIPVELAQLVNLHALFLESNQLVSIPAELGQLTSLQQLYLNNNQLTSIPVELAQLVNLQVLDLNNNQLANIPAELGQLTSLQRLDLDNNQLTSIPVELAQLVNLQVLDLNNNQLANIPAELGQLTSLRHLDLDNNQLAYVPAELGNLTSLQVFYLNNNQLANIPAELEQLTSLQQLYLHNNQLTSIPVELAQLVNLQVLDLNNNQLANIPAELGQLISLQQLYLHNNQLAYVPAELGQLVSLQYLSFDHNKLISVPIELSQLINLQVLSLYKNHLRSVPAELGQLINLQRLYLADNQLTSVPAELGHLTNLQQFSLAINKLTSVPVELGQLTNLQRLGLSDNELTSVPAELGRLEELQELHLRRNKLRHLPSEFVRLRRLNLLGLEENPWRTPPPEIAACQIDDVLNYLSSLQVGATLRYVAKLLILGEGKTGKSSLLRALCGLPFDPDLATTHGINILPYTLPHPVQLDVLLTLNIWDFGGQQIYHTTHQFFMTQRSLYLLVWNARGDTDQGRLDHWLRNIQVLAPDVPVLLVATHIDERPADFNFARFKTAYPQLVGYIGVSNKTGAGIAELRQLIATEAAKLDLMEQQWPQTWVQVETALQQDERYHINSHDYAAICAQNGVTRPGEQATLGGYLHDLGKLLYFQDDDALSDFVVLKPNWLTQTMARVLDDNVTRDQNLGVLEHQDFRCLWPENEADMHYERRLYPLFHRLLERFLLCYRLETDVPGHAQSLVPLLLPHTPPAHLPAWATVLPDQPEIRMLFKLDFVPPGIMSWFIVLSHHYSQNLQWREGVRLQYEGHEADVVLNASTRELWLQVRGPAPSNFFSLLNHMINDRIIRRYFEGLQYKRQIPCICALCKAKPDAERHFFDYDRLAAQKQRGKRLAVVCELSDEEVSILELLEGIHHSTYDRIEEKLDAIHSLVSSDHDLLVQNLQLSEQLTREATRMWNLLTNNLSSEAPSTFLLMPGERSNFNPRNLFDTDFTLYLLCQHPAGPHLVKGEKGYPLPHGHEWWVKVSPWLRELVKYLKYLPKASSIAEAYDQNYYKTIELNVEVFKTAIDITPEFTDDLARHEMERMIDLSRPMEVQGAALRALHTFLKEVDPTLHWCGLRKVATNDGNILWLCAEHAKFHGI